MYKITKEAGKIVFCDTLMSCLFRQEQKHFGKPIHFHRFFIITGSNKDIFEGIYWDTNVNQSSKHLKVFQCFPFWKRNIEWKKNTLFSFFAALKASRQTAIEQSWRKWACAHSQDNKEKKEHAGASSSVLMFASLIELAAPLN